MIEDRLIFLDEDKILRIIRKYFDGNFYIVIFFNKISDEDWLLIFDEIIMKIIKDYFDKD